MEWIINLRNGFTRDYVNGKHLTDDISRKADPLDKDEMKIKCGIKGKPHLQKT